VVRDSGDAEALSQARRLRRSVAQCDPYFGHSKLARDLRSNVPCMRELYGCSASSEVSIILDCADGIT
jgi:hypothetical protein